MSFGAELQQVPGRGWRWVLSDGGSPVESGRVFHGSAGEAEVEAVEALGGDWPGAPTEGFAFDAELEDGGWHVVGADGEPGFEADWYAAALDEGDTVTVSPPRFRLARPGALDLAGIARNDVDPSADPVIFRLRPGYRPEGVARLPTVGHTAAGNTAACVVSIDSDGYVRVSRIANGALVNPRDVELSGRVFLDA